MCARPIGGAALEVRPLETLASDFDDVYLRLRRSVRSRTRRAVGLQPLPEAQRELLWAVQQRPGISVGGAALALQLAGNTVSTLVRQLVAGDLLERRRDEQNRRLVHLYLTPRAEVRFSVYRSARTELLLQALADLDESERAEIERALPALSHLVSRLEAPGG
jgi:DNA-binding MarR family transcriptional regulator